MTAPCAPREPGSPKATAAATANWRRVTCGRDGIVSSSTPLFARLGQRARHGKSFARRNVGWVNPREGGGRPNAIVWRHVLGHRSARPSLRPKVAQQPLLMLEEFDAERIARSGKANCHLRLHGAGMRRHDD